MDAAYQRYRLFHVLVQKLYLIMELDRLRNMSRFFEVGGIQGSRTSLSLL